MIATREMLVFGFCVGRTFRQSATAFNNSHSELAKCCLLGHQEIRTNVSSAEARGTPLNEKNVLEKDFSLRKVLLVRKVTRYEYEKFHLKPDLGEEKLQKHVRLRR